MSVAAGPDAVSAAVATTREAATAEDEATTEEATAEEEATVEDWTCDVETWDETTAEVDLMTVLEVLALVEVEARVAKVVGALLAALEDATAAIEVLATAEEEA